MNKPAKLTKPFEEAGEKLYKLDPDQAKRDAARFFLELLKTVQTEQAE